MVREDILGILKTAVQKGRNLQQSAQSLKNAGYPENEVDDAVNSINNYIFQPTQIQKPVVSNSNVQNPPPQFVKGQTPQYVSNYSSATPQRIVPQNIPAQNVPLSNAPVANNNNNNFQQVQPVQQVVQTPQYVSNYEGKPKDKAGKVITMVMVALLIILIGILVMVFAFKPEIMSFIDNLGS